MQYNWEKLDSPEKIIVLGEHLNFKDYQVLVERYCRQLSKLKLQFEPHSQIKPDWGRIIVLASKTRVHGIPSGLFSDIALRIWR
jgi:hypothetical protein